MSQIELAQYSKITEVGCVALYADENELVLHNKRDDISMAMHEWGKEGEGASGWRTLGILSIQCGPAADALTIFECVWKASSDWIKKNTTCDEKIKITKRERADMISNYSHHSTEKIFKTMQEIYDEIDDSNIIQEKIVGNKEKIEQKNIEVKKQSELRF